MQKHNKPHPQLDWKIGIEIEMVAPKGVNRRDLAKAIALHFQGNVTPYFHPQVEPSKVSGQSLFKNLTPAFEVRDQHGQRIAQCVDDLTLQDDLDKTASPQAGWYRIVSDEHRLLQLVMQQADASDPLSDVLTPIAHLFGTEPQHGHGEMVRVMDQTGESIAIAAPLPGERERPCELITAPIDHNHYETLDVLLGIAHQLGFKPAAEGAIHIHFDATALMHASVLANLMRVLWQFGDELKTLVKSNPRCRRLGRWPQALYDHIQQPEWSDLDWQQATQSLAPFEVSKHCDFNIKNIIDGNVEKQTFELRILPVCLDATTTLETAKLFEAMLQWAIHADKGQQPPATLHAFMGELTLSAKIIEDWQQRL